MRDTFKTSRLFIVLLTMLCTISAGYCDTFFLSSASNPQRLDLETIIGIPWVLIKSPGDIKNLRSYQIFNPEEGFALYKDDETVLWRLKKGEWNRVQIPSYADRILCFFAIPPNDLWLNTDTAIPYKQNLIHFDGRDWHEMRTPNTARIRDIWFTSPESGWAACEWGQIMHFDRHTWKQVFCPTPNHINNIIMVNDTAGWAITDRPHALLKYQNNKWDRYSGGHAETTDRFILLDTYSKTKIKRPNDIFWEKILSRFEMEDVPTDTVQFELTFQPDDYIWAHKTEPVIYRGGTLVYPFKKSLPDDLIYVCEPDLSKEKDGWNYHTFWLFSKNGLKRKLTFKIPLHRVVPDTDRPFLSAQISSSSEYGICIADLNGDGIEDRYAVVTWGPNKLYVFSGPNSDSPEREVSESAGVTGPMQLEDDRANYDIGASSADIDNDGDQEILVTSLYGPNLLFKQVRRGFFRESSKILNIGKNYGRSVSGIWGDINNDGYIDLCVANEDSTNRLFLNNGAGYFKDITRISGLQMEWGGGGSLFTDIDGDGDLDLFIPRRGRRNLLYLNEGLVNGEKAPRFREVSGERGIAGADTISHSTCGISGDIDNDGDLDLFVTNLTGSNWLYLNDGNGFFNDVTVHSGLQDTAMSQTALFLDGDNDGDLDLFVGNYGRSVYYQNEGNRVFIDKTEETGCVHDGFVMGMAYSDLEDDGDLDVYISDGFKNTSLLKNGCNDSNYMKINLKGSISNRDAVGAKVFLYQAGSLNNTDSLSAMRELSGGNGYNSMSSRIVHFGVPDGNPKDVLVLFPSGIRIQLSNIAPGAMFTVFEETGIRSKMTGVKKWIVRTVNYPPNQQSAVFLFLFLSVLVFFNGFFLKKAWWQPKILLLSGLLPGVSFLILYCILLDTMVLIRIGLPVIFGFGSAVLGILYGRKIFGQTILESEMVEKLFLAANSFFHGEWGARKLNRLRLYCANIEPDTMPSDELRENLDEAIQDFYALIVPEIERILAYGRVIHISEGLDHDIQSDLLILTRELNQVRVDLRIGRVQDNTMKGLLERIEWMLDHLRLLREKVGEVFTCPIEETLGELMRTYQKRYGFISFNSDGSEKILVRIRPVEFSQILENVLDNAILAVNTQPDKEIGVSWSVNADFVHIEILDNGEGVPQDIQKKLFVQQVTTKKNGGGFGLFHAKQLLEKYGGDIRLVQSGPDQKTIIRIQLKRVDNA